jgi:hypothetical protein
LSRFMPAASSVLSSFSKSVSPAQSSKTSIQKPADSVFGPTHSPGRTIWVVNLRVGLTSMRTSAIGKPLTAKPQPIAKRSQIRAPSKAGPHDVVVGCPITPREAHTDVRKVRLCWRSRCVPRQWEAGREQTTNVQRKLFQEGAAQWCGVLSRVFIRQAQLHAKVVKLVLFHNRNDSDRAGPACLNRLSASISGGSAGIRPPRGAAKG